MAGWQEFSGLNRGYVLELYEKYRQDPAAVDAETRAIFEQWSPPAEAPVVHDGIAYAQIVGAARLAQAIRRYGHLSAKLDPLGLRVAVGDPSLLPETHNVTDEDLRNLPPDLVSSPLTENAGNMADVIRLLRTLYCSTSGYDYNHVFVPEERRWLRQAAEGGRFRAPLDPISPIALLERLTQVEVFERFLHRAFPGKTRFSIEGLDMLVPILDEVIGEAAESGIRNILIGMAHRGRLNVMAHVLNKPYAQILAEFKEPISSRSFREDMAWTGDVKYHAGAHRALKGGRAMDVVVSMPPNPSHLEAIDPIVEGMARAAGTIVDSPGAPTFDPTRSLPILIHGDAAFPGQGVVAETLNLSRLPGYRTGGTIHIIVNNQLGFTTGAEDAYSTSYASGLARGFKIPIVHVNADDPEACVEAARLACAYRERFQRDFLIDLIGYRRHGHNEGDEPAFTQPLMYQRIASHPTVRERWARTLEERGELTPGVADDLVRKYSDELQGVMDGLKPERDFIEPQPEAPPPGAAAKAETAVPLVQLREMNEALVRLPTDFVIHRKLERLREKRLHMFDNPDERTVDWSAAEDLALASILADGISIRLTGEDVERGTFSHRHAVLHDANDGKVHVPLQALPHARAAFEIHNSPLTENALVGFEYRLQHPGTRTAGDLGSAVWRLHQRRPDDDRRVHRIGPRQMGSPSVARLPAAACARGSGSRSRECTSRTLPPARGRHQRSYRELHDRRAILPPAAASGGAPARRPIATRRAEPEEPATASDRRVDAARSGGGALPDGVARRRRVDAGGGCAPGVGLLWQGLRRPDHERASSSAPRDRDLPPGTALPGADA